MEFKKKKMQTILIQKEEIKTEKKFQIKVKRMKISILYKIIIPKKNQFLNKKKNKIMIKGNYLKNKKKYIMKSLKLKKKRKPNNPTKEILKKILKTILIIK